MANRDDAVKILADAGLETMDTTPYLAFRHRVDQAILRDIIVARKPGKIKRLDRHRKGHDELPGRPCA